VGGGDEIAWREKSQSADEPIFLKTSLKNGGSKKGESGLEKNTYEKG